MDRVLFAPRVLTPLRPNVADDPGPFDTWVREREVARCLATAEIHRGRDLNVVMVIDARPPAETPETLRSLSTQLGSSWRLTVAHRWRWNREVMALVSASGIRQDVDFETCTETVDFEGLLRDALAKAGNLDVAFIFPGDVWAPDTTMRLSEALLEADVAYADEDCLDDEGAHVQPRLKPSFSPEFLLHANCVGRPLAISAGVAARLPAGTGDDDRTREHDLAFRACETARSVAHISEVLCHRKTSTLTGAGSEHHLHTQHITAALARQGVSASVRPGAAHGTMRIERTPSAARSASIIIPFRDEPRLLRACVESIDRTKGVVTPYFLLIDNGSVQPETITLLEQLDRRPDVRVLHDDRPFNWAGLNNAAATSATGDILVFLNNDIEALTQGWLDALCSQAERPDIGAVGARLIYPDHRLQHCGVVIGLGGAAGHLLVGLGETQPGYLDMAVTTRECSAVTGACLATRRDVFESQGRFDESLGIDLNDIDYCLRMQKSGLRVIYEPRAELIHHESPSRGTAGDVRDIVLFVDRWTTSILAGDHYLSPHLTRIDSSCALRNPGEEEWWHRWRIGLSQV